MGSGVDVGALLAERYRLERVLGSGGMASVWLARDERLERPVAVKLISDSLAHEPSYLSRFRREARLAAGLSHPNLVQVYDFGGEDERPYLVMEYVEGETLAGHIAAGTALELDPKRLARELLGALSASKDKQRETPKTHLGPTQPTRSRPHRPASLRSARARSRTSRERPRVAASAEALNAAGPPPALNSGCLSSGSSRVRAERAICHRS